MSHCQLRTTLPCSKSEKSRNLSVYIFLTLYTSSYLNRIFHNHRKYTESMWQSKRPVTTKVIEKCIIPDTNINIVQFYQAKDALLSMLDHASWRSVVYQSLGCWGKKSRFSFIMSNYIFRLFNKMNNLFMAYDCFWKSRQERGHIFSAIAQ